ncbi:MAG: hypothetical protein WA071_28690, partial [Undibacterium umbellatum]|uniref:hypothetical protein n=1 Tax=Undibacterium umbellatum TaxID=2762300 RepID=UPI003BB4DDD8
WQNLSQLARDLFKSKLCKGCASFGVRRIESHKKCRIQRKIRLLADFSFAKLKRRRLLTVAMADPVREVHYQSVSIIIKFGTQIDASNSSYQIASPFNSRKHPRVTIS